MKAEQRSVQIQPSVARRFSPTLRAALIPPWAFKHSTQLVTRTKVQAVGFKALANSVNNNDAFGYKALGNNTTGFLNTAIGVLALSNNTTGAFNVALGAVAGATATTGSDNIFIGFGINGVVGESGACYIGISLARPRLEESRSSSIIPVSSALSLPRRVSRKPLPQWTKPAKRCFHSNQLPSATRRTLIQEAHHSSGSSPRT